MLFVLKNQMAERTLLLVVVAPNKNALTEKVIVIKKKLRNIKTLQNCNNCNFFSISKKYNLIFGIALVDVLI